MTRRRYVAPGRVTCNDRRTTHRHYLFTPDAERRMEQIFWYCLAVSAKKYGIVVHVAVLMSTHFHYVVTDVLGKLPAFRQEFHRMLAMCTKEFRDWPEEVLSKAPTGEHEPLTPKALVRQMAYAIANPSAAGAVRYSKDWPGAKTLVSDIGSRVVTMERPDYYLDEHNEDWPDVATLPIEMPDMLIEAYGSVEAARAEIAKEVSRLEHEARQKLEAEGRSFMGARRVLRIHHTHRASSREEFGARNPMFAAAGDIAALRAAIRVRRAFDHEYEAALARWTAGDRTVVFPAGTWWMRVHHRARCHPPP
ncbi:MAG: transposase [Deltaproteobacteria bacterium]|nr:transposase [Deltaproteobacteria bacterium]